MMLKEFLKIFSRMNLGRKVESQTDMAFIVCENTLHMVGKEISFRLIPVLEQ